ncbi:hypothetical protein B0O99DRAFT_705591 [Bisporella sp. PMI_857]|nr:hypothetical protein B0O99DRAFT_705591 [Bisporella sp. PMI_857]
MPVDGCIGCLNSFMPLKARYSHLKVPLSIGGGATSQSFVATASTARKRHNFTRSAKGFLALNFSSKPIAGSRFSSLLASIINLMAYDFAGPQSEEAVYHTQPYPGAPSELSSSAAVDCVLSTGFLPAKILLGVPAYVRSFLGADAPGQSYSGNSGDGGTVFCVSSGGAFASYDGHETVRIKANYCKEEELVVSRSEPPSLIQN